MHIINYKVLQGHFSIFYLAIDCQGVKSTKIKENLVFIKMNTLKWKLKNT